MSYFEPTNNLHPTDIAPGDQRLHDGGDFPMDGFDALATSLRARALKIAPATIRRLARAYGTEARIILAQGHLGRIFGADLGEYEVAFLMEKEWARTADDILWRRSKLGLRFTSDEVAALTRYMEDAFKRRGTV